MQMTCSGICKKEKSIWPSLSTNTDDGGVITRRNLLEEIVGNIYDEFDSEEPPEIVQLEDNLWRISGGAYVEDIAEALDLDLPEDIDYDTLGGMIFSCLRSPADGSQFDVQVTD